MQAKSMNQLCQTDNRRRISIPTIRPIIMIKEIYAKPFNVFGSFLSPNITPNPENKIVTVKKTTTRVTQTWRRKAIDRLASVYAKTMESIVAHVRRVMSKIRMYLLYSSSAFATYFTRTLCLGHRSLPVNSASVTVLLRDRYQLAVVRYSPK
jgi:hypothetical protein